MKFSTTEKHTKDSRRQKTVLMPIFEDEAFESGSIDATQAKSITETLEEKEFLGQIGEVFILPREGSGRWVLLGLGKKSEFTSGVWRRALGTAVRHVQARGMLDLHLFLPKAIEAAFDQGLLKLSAYEMVLASYQFNDYFTDTTRVLKPLKSASFEVFGSRDAAADSRALKEGRVTGEAANFARQLGNLPPIEMTPKYLTRQAQRLARENQKLKVRALGWPQIRREKMGGLEGVALGSRQEPQFIVLEWMNAPKTYGTHVFAGKAITFDSGGISLKPANKMDEMKFDMLGGGSVLGAMKAVAELNLKVNVVGLIPATENLSGSGAYRPGDILRARNGKTIEVINTDAEGRLVLADALSYASKYKPKSVVDIATLTGAAAVALGGPEGYGAAFSRDQAFRGTVETAAEASADKIWPMPLDDDYAADVQSGLADVRNTPKSGQGGASGAAAFLEAFTGSASNYPKDTRWAHIDIAGVGWDEEKPYRSSGATGYGTAILTELAKSWEK